MSDSEIIIGQYIQQFPIVFPELKSEFPWYITDRLKHILAKRIRSLSTDYKISGDIAIHKTSRIEEHVILKGPIIISPGCFVGAHAYLRDGLFIGDQVVIGPGCEVKSSIIMPHSALAHFNFVGDSIIGSMVNLEAGSVIANHFNERDDKVIYVLVDGKKISTQAIKFGALVGDRTKIGANAVLSPGTILVANSVVPRLQLIEQC
ncbi:MAG: hypothetical protein MUO54_08010 [Anaerolineales bacterium]|nr:hypothetical protein [Anaerolineales bacterium]